MTDGVIRNPRLADPGRAVEHRTLARAAHPGSGPRGRSTGTRPAASSTRRSCAWRRAAAPIASRGRCSSSCPTSSWSCGRARARGSGSWEAWWSSS